MQNALGQLTDGSLAAPWRRTWAAALRRPVLSIFLLALAARGVVIAFVAITHDGYLFQDDRGYLEIAHQAATGNTENWDAYTRQLYGHNATFLLPISGLFRVFGYQPFLAQLFVGVCGAATAALVVRLCLEAVPVRPAMAAGAVVALLPAQVLFSSLTLKDALVWLSLAGLGLLAALAGRLHGRRLLGLGAVVLVVLVLLGFLREHTLVVSVWSLALTTWAAGRRDWLLRTAAAVLLALLVPAVLGAGLGGRNLLTSVSSLERQRALGAQGAETAVVAPVPAVKIDPTQALADARRRAAAAAAELAAAEQQAGEVPPASEQEAAAARARLEALRARAEQQAQEAREAAERERRAAAAAADHVPGQGLDGSFGDDAGSTAATRNLLYLPKGLAVMILQPYPWTSTDNVRLRLAQAESIVWYPVLLLALCSLFALRRRARVLAFPLVVGGGTATMWALVEGNFGTAYRHRGEFIWAAAVLAAAGLAVLSDRRRAARDRADAAQPPPGERVADAVAVSPP